jgi:prepilin-type N-terminal cleavage/methylation domain-containing protein
MRRGYTLIELTVVASVMALFAGLTWFGAQAARERLSAKDEVTDAVRFVAALRLRALTRSEDLTIVSQSGDLVARDRSDTEVMRFSGRRLGVALDAVSFALRDGALVCGREPLRVRMSSGSREFSVRAEGIYGPVVIEESR